MNTKNQGSREKLIGVEAGLAKKKGDVEDGLISSRSCKYSPSCARISSILFVGFLISAILVWILFTNPIGGGSIARVFGIETIDYDRSSVDAYVYFDSTKNIEPDSRESLYTRENVSAMNSPYERESDPEESEEPEVAIVAVNFEESRAPEWEKTKKPRVVLIEVAEDNDDATERNEVKSENEASTVSRVPEELDDQDSYSVILSSDEHVVVKPDSICIDRRFRSIGEALRKVRAFNPISRSNEDVRGETFYVVFDEQYDAYELCFVPFRSERDEGSEKLMIFEVTPKNPTVNESNRELGEVRATVPRKFEKIGRKEKDMETVDSMKNEESDNGNGNGESLGETTTVYEDLSPSPMTSTLEEDPSTPSSKSIIFPEVDEDGRGRPSLDVHDYVLGDLGAGDIISCFPGDYEDYSSDESYSFDDYPRIFERSVSVEDNNGPRDSTGDETGNVKNTREDVQPDANVPKRRDGNVPARLGRSVGKDVLNFDERMEILAAHIDRLQERYEKQNELNDDYISTELSVDETESGAKNPEDDTS